MIVASGLVTGYVTGFTIISTLYQYFVSVT